LLKAPGGEAKEQEARRNFQVTIKDHDQMENVRYLNVRVDETGGEGWVPADSVDETDSVPSPIDEEQFARQCCFSQIHFGIPAGYLVAVAALRSGIKDGKVGDEIGPFRMRDSEWAADWGATEPPLRLDQGLGDWRKQCDVFAMMAAKTIILLEAKIEHRPNITELLLAQMAGVGVAALAKQSDQTLETLVTRQAPGQGPRGLTNQNTLDHFEMWMSLDTKSVTGQEAYKQIESKLQTELEKTKQLVERMATEVILTAFPPTATPAAPGSDLAKRAFDLLVQDGRTKEAACGIIANIDAESKFLVNAVGDGGLAYGLCQWHPDRQARFKELLGKDIKASTFEEQLRFIGLEIQQFFQRVERDLREATSASAAAESVCLFYEAPADKDVKAKERASRAEEYLIQFRQPQQDSGTPTGEGADVAQEIIASCEAKLKTLDLRNDCKKFLLAVLADFFDSISDLEGGQADDVVNRLRSPGSGWTSCNRSIDTAIAKAKSGDFVVAGMTSTDLGQHNGHVAVVVGGDDSRVPIVPVGYAGSLGGAAPLEGGRLSETFPTADVHSEKVDYFFRTPDRTPA
jgi:hypothetical protein